MNSNNKIVILDGNTVNPGDLDWKPIERFGQCEVYPRTPPEKTYERSQDADIIITSKVILDREMIGRLPRLKYVGVIATGYNVVDLKAARERDIPVTNIPNYCTASVAQMVISHILELARRVGHHDKSVKEGNWSTSIDFCFWDYPQLELTGRVLGLIGCGNIGSAVAQIAVALGMKVIAYDIFPREDPSIEFVDLNTVFSTSDIVSLHCPLTEDTLEIINKSNLSKMKKTAFLINTSRGPLVNENELTDALNSDVIAGAGLDVLRIEPPQAGNPLFQAKNCHITPHLAWASQEARELLIQLTADNIQAFLEGRSVNVVN